MLGNLGDRSDHCRGASNVLVHSLPLEVITPSSSFSKTCSICLCEFEVGEQVATDTRLRLKEMIPQTNQCPFVLVNLLM